MHPKTVSRFSDGFFVRDGGKSHYGVEVHNVLLAFVSRQSLSVYTDLEVNVLSKAWWPAPASISPISLSPLQDPPRIVLPEIYK